MERDDRKQSQATRTHLAVIVQYLENTGRGNLVEQLTHYSTVNNSTYTLTGWKEGGGNGRALTLHYGVIIYMIYYNINIIY